ncbi:C-type lection lectoxin-Enh3 [Exaiptasia diaphana]|uniref:Uncharacterized protein n=1 Tax=Exaiptasia diaphana TaxID=2652724 RepID=A0A913YDC7_EXADI|nr:C-type lection lectoxin-Enh3 [Exaiptasia diaphana]XP_028513029.1 C-type lection lectoxin-Enh3 [Exaiptasia diaphana]XP_028513030.1 C-type lection lectoxin-Enh3 [Exaiptasia diaphana]KXJ18079.1 C-type lectin lectoxin-Enh5 [Exaiptasia diaphana]
MVFINLAAALCTCLIALIVVENKACKKSTDFDRHPGIKLQSNMIKKITTSDLVNCVTECVKSKGCLSINSHNARNAIHCEINKSNRYGMQANLIKTSLDWEYLEKVFDHRLPDACFQKDGWFRNKSVAFKFVNEAAGALEARQRCQNMSTGADLVSFVDKEEEQIFDQYLEGVRQGDYVWIGFNDRTKEGTFVWFDGTKPKYTNWYKGEPNNYGGNEHCTIKSQRGDLKWHDNNCFRQHPFACKVLCS